MCRNNPDAVWAMESDAMVEIEDEFGRVRRVSARYSPNLFAQTMLNILCDAVTIGMLGRTLVMMGVWSLLYDLPITISEAERLKNERKRSRSRSRSRSPNRERSAKRKGNRKTRWGERYLLRRAYRNLRSCTCVHVLTK